MDGRTDGPLRVPAGEPGSTGCCPRAWAAGGSAGLERSFSDRELLSAGSAGDCSERLGLVQPRSAAQGGETPVGLSPGRMRPSPPPLTPGTLSRLGRGCGTGAPRAGDVPLSEEEEEMERESSCSCSSAC